MLTAAAAAEQHVLRCPGLASGVLSLLNGVLGGLVDGLLPSQLTGIGAPYTITITKGTTPTFVDFSQRPQFTGIAGITITASGSGPTPGLLGLSNDQVRRQTRDALCLCDSRTRMVLHCKVQTSSGLGGRCSWTQAVAAGYARWTL